MKQFQANYILFDHNLATMLDLPFNDPTQPLSEYDIITATIKYAYNRKGVINDTFNFDDTLWRSLDVNRSMPITTTSVWHYLAKYVEEIP